MSQNPPLFLKLFGGFSIFHENYSFLGHFGRKNLEKLKQGATKITTRIPITLERHRRLKFFLDSSYPTTLQLLKQRKDLWLCDDHQMNQAIIRRRLGLRDDDPGQVNFFFLLHYPYSFLISCSAMYFDFIFA